MNRFFWVMFLIVALGTAGCSGASPATPIPTISLEPPSSSEPTFRVSASAESVPALASDLGFVISGFVEELAVGAGDQVQAGDTLAVLSTPELEYAVEAAQAVVRAAELNVTIQNFARKKYNEDGTVSYLKLPFEKRQIADAQLVQAQAALQAAKSTLAQNTLSAPFDGTIVSVDVVPGEFVQTGQKIILLADLENLCFETTDLSETNITKISVGQAATIFVDALNQEFPGTVTRISPVSETLGGDVVYRVTVKPDEKIAGLLWGMSAEIEFVMEE
ncbi:MAG: hypothetical protein Kow002_17710 [Anaerolineales bacterium]